MAALFYACLYGQQLQHFQYLITAVSASGLISYGTTKHLDTWTTQLYVKILASHTLFPWYDLSLQAPHCPSTLT